MKNYPADKGMALVCSMMKAGYVAQFWGKPQTLLSNGINHSLVHGKPYYFPASEIPNLQNAIRMASSELLKQRVVPAEGEERRESIVQQMKAIGKMVKLPYIIMQQMGMTEGAMKQRLSIKNGDYYGKFTDEQIVQFNNALVHISIEVCNIELTEN